KAGDQQLKNVGHGRSFPRDRLFRRDCANLPLVPAKAGTQYSSPAWRLGPRFRGDERAEGTIDPLHFPSLGRILVIFCWPLTTSARKLMRSISPLSSQVVSIRIPGSSCGVMVKPCIACAKPLRSNLPSFFSVTYLTA